MARTTLSDLIERVRLLIHDADSNIFSDDEIQDALDQHRSDVRYLELEAAETIQAGGSIVYLDYYAGRGDWESDEVLYDASYNALTPQSADRLTGHWVFAESQSPPVYIVGKAYDLFASAADLLEAWASREKLSVDVGADGTSLQRSQRFEMLLGLARQYRARSRPRRVEMVVE